MSTIFTDNNASCHLNRVTKLESHMTAEERSAIRVAKRLKFGTSGVVARNLGLGATTRAEGKTIKVLVVNKVNASGLEASTTRAEGKKTKVQVINKVLYDLKKDIVLNNDKELDGATDIMVTEHDTVSLSQVQVPILKSALADQTLETRSIKKVHFDFEEEEEEQINCQQLSTGSNIEESPAIPSVTPEAAAAFMITLLHPAWVTQDHLTGDAMQRAMVKHWHWRIKHLHTCLSGGAQQSLRGETINLEWLHSF